LCSYSITFYAILTIGKIGLTFPAFSARLDDCQDQTQMTNAELQLPEPIVELRSSFIEAMSRAVSGVTVVTAAEGEQRYGQTVSAMSSVTADPPTLLVCLHQKSRLNGPLQRAGRFAVNILRADQRRVSDVFAGRPRHGVPYDFDVAVWETGVSGAPLLTGAVATFDCELEAQHLFGTHYVYFGHVLDAHFAGGTPLAYGQRGYGEMMQFPHRFHDARSVPAGFVGVEWDNEPLDLWEREEPE
jgi:flavin reductase (DIM6/NTAB) family NADH-FMN oxidoreductase RutF